ncbi:MAG: ATP synthase subunit I [Desulfobacterales bacterium]|nr:ATP synthase subunit I [Desulfobacterales bacterium]
MKEIRETQKKYCSLSLVTAIIIGFFLIIAGQSTVGKGLILGTLFSSINFALMGEVLPHKVGKSRGKTYLVAVGSIISRYLLLAVPIVLCIRSPERFNLFAVIIGIFMVQLVILLDYLKSAILLTRRKKI